MSFLNLQEIKLSFVLTTVEPLSWNLITRALTAKVSTPNSNSASPLVGVAKDGFAIYGPVQWYSASSGKIWMDPTNCSDCVLTRMDTTTLDVCNGLEVEDGDSTVGDNYR